MRPLTLLAISMAFSAVMPLAGCTSSQAITYPKEPMAPTQEVTETQRLAPNEAPRPK